MPKVRAFLLGFLFVPLAWSAVHADDAASARMIVEQAIKASGDLEKYAKFSGVTVKGKGTIHVMGMMIPFTMDLRYQLPDKSRSTIDAEIMGQKFTIVNVFDGEKGWVKIADAVNDMSEDQVAEARDQIYALTVTGLLGLRDQAFKLATLGEGNVDGRTALGVRVSREGKPDISLWFDKESGLLVKSQMRIKDGMTGMEVDEATYFLDYQLTDGVKSARKLKVLRDGNPFLEAEVESTDTVEKQEAGLFTKP